MSDPKIGMHYKDVRKKLMGPLGKDPAIRSSLLNQARLCEGEKAVVELEKETSPLYKSSLYFSGSGNRQTGMGDGEKLGPGKWKYMGPGKWVKVS